MNCASLIMLAPVSNKEKKLSLPLFDKYPVLFPGRVLQNTIDHIRHNLWKLSRDYDLLQLFYDLILSASV